MSDYISRDALRKYLNECITGDLFNRDMKRAVIGIEVYVENMSAADMQPAKRGQWLNHHAIWIEQPKIEGWFVQAKCSECEKWAHVMNPYTKSVDYECCPHCGARMMEG